MIKQHSSLNKRVYRVVLPLRVDLSKKSHINLNLNWYRNAHFYTLNSSKVLFKEQIWDQLKDLPFFTSVRLKYVIYPGSKRLLDVANVGSVIDKYFCDAMTESEHWEDDNYTVVKEVTYAFGEIDKANPRAEVFIEELFDFKEFPMRITLEQNEVNEALSQYLQKNFNINPKQISGIDYTAGRGSNGITCAIDFSSGNAENSTEPRTELAKGKENDVQSTSVQKEVSEVDTTTEDSSSDLTKIFK